MKEFPWRGNHCFPSQPWPRRPHQRSMFHQRWRRFSESEGRSLTILVATPHSMRFTTKANSASLAGGSKQQNSVSPFAQAKIPYESRTLREIGAIDSRTLLGFLRKLLMKRWSDLICRILLGNSAITDLVFSMSTTFLQCRYGNLLENLAAKKFSASN